MNVKEKEISGREQKEIKFVSVQYDGRDLLTWIPFILLLGIVGVKLSVGWLIIPSIVAYLLYTYLYFLIKKNFKIIITQTLIIWETILERKAIPLYEVAFLGVGDDYMQRYMNNNTVYAKDRIIHLLHGNTIMSFNPKCFYEENSFFKIYGNEKEQLHWKNRDSEIISYLEAKCTYAIEQKRKILLLRKVCFMDILNKISLFFVCLIPIIHVIFYELYKQP